MTVIASVGAQTFLGWAPEVVAGTAVPATKWVPIEPDNLSLGYDPKRTPVELGVGTLFAQQYAVEMEATASGDIAFPVMSSLGQELIFQCGFLDAPTGTTTVTHAGAVSRPKFTTLEVYRAGQSFQYAGQLAKSLKWEASARQQARMTISFDGIKPPALITSSINTYAVDQPYVWGNFGNVSLASGATGSADVESMELTLAFENQLFYGSANSQLPTIIVPGVVSVTGRFTKIFQSLAEYNAFLTAGMTPGQIVFTFTRGTNVAALTMPKCVYTRQSFKTPIRGPVTEDFEFIGLAPTGINPLSYTVVNSDAGAYSVA